MFGESVTKEVLYLPENEVVIFLIWFRLEMPKLEFAHSIKSRMIIQILKFSTCKINIPNIFSEFCSVFWKICLSADPRPKKPAVVFAFC